MTSAVHGLHARSAQLYAEGIAQPPCMLPSVQLAVVRTALETQRASAQELSEELSKDAMKAEKVQRCTVEVTCYV